MIYKIKKKKVEKIASNKNVIQDLEPVFPEDLKGKSQLDEYFYRTTLSETVERIYTTSINNELAPPNILTFGPPGTGKSETLTQIAYYVVEAMDLHEFFGLIKIPCAQLKEPEEFYCSPFIDSNGSIKYKANWVAQAIHLAEKGYYVFVIFEELEALNPRLQVALNTLLDRVNCFITWPTGELKSLKENRHRLFFSATVNPPKAGTPSHEIIHSLYSRFTVKLKFDFNTIQCREILLKKFWQYNVHDDRELTPCDLCKLPILINQIRKSPLFRKIQPAYREAIEICNLRFLYEYDWESAISLVIPGKNKDQEDFMKERIEIFVKEGE
ncbi:MAG: AAA domain-containing protein [Candidatus Lokiarchaeota archaeon]|nr:AAA domain-containing protein [Candidatus Lokiarchaeota archaeon]